MNSEANSGQSGDVNSDVNSEANNEMNSTAAAADQQREREREREQEQASTAPAAPAAPAVPTTPADPAAPPVQPAQPAQLAQADQVAPPLPEHAGRGFELDPCGDLLPPYLIDSDAPERPAPRQHWARLPHGIEIAYHASFRLYFVDLVGRATSFRDPRMEPGDFRTQQREQLDAVPAPWRLEPFGNTRRPTFVHALTGEVSHYDPRLPAGWETHRSPIHNNRVYYIDRNSMETTWSDPRMEPPMPCAHSLRRWEAEYDGGGGGGGGSGWQFIDLSEHRTLQHDPRLKANPPPLCWLPRVASSGRIYWLHLPDAICSWRDPRTTSQPCTTARSDVEDWLTRQQAYQHASVLDQYRSTFLGTTTGALCISQPIQLHIQHPS